MKREYYTTYIDVRLLPSEKAELKRQASEAHLGMGRYIVSKLVTKPNTVMEAIEDLPIDTPI